MTTPEKRFALNFFKLTFLISTIGALAYNLYCAYIGPSVDVLQNVVVVGIFSLMTSSIVSTLAYIVKKFSKIDAVRLILYFPFALTVFSILFTYIAMTTFGFLLMIVFIIMAPLFIFYILFAWLYTFYEIYRMKKSTT